MGKAGVDPWTRNDCAHAQIMAGRIAQARGETAASAAAWAKALAMTGPGAKDSNDWRLLEPAALAATLAGQVDVAAPLVARLKSFGYHPPDPLVAATLGLAGEATTSTPTPNPASR
jgi:hypothetical protein